MTAPRSLVLSGIALAAALASMPSHAGWLSNLWGSGGSQTGVSYDDSWSDAAGTATAPATSTTTSPTATPKPTLTARPARTVADSTGTVALTGVEQRWKKPIEDSGKMLRSEIPAIVGSQQVGYAPAWTKYFNAGEEKCMSPPWVNDAILSEYRTVCIKINGNKELILELRNAANKIRPLTVLAVPRGYEPLHFAVPVSSAVGNNCITYYTGVAEPLFNRLEGGIPWGWQATISLGEKGSGCGFQGGG
mgnify:CR=1 FL=1